MINYVNILDKHSTAKAASGKGGSGIDYSFLVPENTNGININEPFKSPSDFSYYINNTNNNNSNPGIWDSLFGKGGKLDTTVNPGAATSNFGSAMSGFGAAAGGLAGLYGLYQANQNYKAQQEKYNYLKNRDAMRDAAHAHVATAFQPTTAARTTL